MLVGGAARTDLIAPALTDGLTRAQFRTLRCAFSHLPDETLLLPTHGGGSFCSTGAGKQRSSTLGDERRTNPLLSFEDEDEFASWFPSTFPAAPSYFFRLRSVNQAGPRLRSQIHLPRLLEAAEARALRNHAIVLDVRPQRDFMAAHVPGSISNTFREGFATWLGWLIPPDARLLLVVGDEPLGDVVEECLLVGYEKFAGVLGGGMAGWTEARFETVHARSADAADVRTLLLDGALALDVREPSELAAGHIPGAVHIPLGELQRHAKELPRDRPIVTYCGHGERSATALSLLERLGFGRLVNFNGGFGAWQEAGLEVER
jgi:rhodanese-related sulfurtransferase